MVSCAACGRAQTSKSKQSGITFHYFPKNEERRKTWIDFVKTPGFAPKKTSVLCSSHFAKECFDRSSQLIIRLFPSAVPTIEVDRLKYARTFNPETTRSVEHADEAIQSQVETTPEKNNSLNAFAASTSATTLSPPPERLDSCVVLEITPSNGNLERKIQMLYKKDRLKTQKIRSLQKVVWRQKKQIASLKAISLELRKDIKKKLESRGLW